MYTLFHLDSVSVNNVAMSYENGPEYFLQVSEKVGEREGGREGEGGEGERGEMGEGERGRGGERDNSSMTCYFHGYRTCET